MDTLAGVSLLFTTEDVGVLGSLAAINGDSRERKALSSSLSQTTGTARRFYQIDRIRIFFE